MLEKGCILHQLDPENIPDPPCAVELNEDEICIYELNLENYERTKAWVEKWFREQTFEVKQKRKV